MNLEQLRKLGYRIDAQPSRGYRLPTHAQHYLEAARTTVDFYYQGDFAAAVYIDGPPHDFPDRTRRDEDKTEFLRDDLGVAGINGFRLYKMLRLGRDENRFDRWPDRLRFFVENVVSAAGFPRPFAGVAGATRTMPLPSSSAVANASRNAGSFLALTVMLATGKSISCSLKRSSRGHFAVGRRSPSTRSSA